GVGWDDPAMLPDSPHISATTELVNINIVEATESYIRGGYSARFTEALHGVVGTVSGDFVQARADTEKFHGPDDPLDSYSSDLLLSMYYAGMTGEQLRAMANQAGEGANAATGTSAGTGSSTKGPSCNCDCAEFDSPRRDSCSGQCLGYAPVAAQCVVQREVSKGRSHDAVLKELNACPSDCPSLRGSVSTICGDALYGPRRACLASGPGGISQKQVDCYLDYVVRDLEAPQKGSLRKQLADQIEQMDAGGRDQYIGALLDAMKGEGHSCPAR
ncbi:hypothetical protein, partial [Nevskia sp.]|uniref:hypothetical protein n=1 Tax=Nevskia sp. TaxID=1929292 RepID=UPI0025CF9E75